MIKTQIGVVVPQPNGDYLSECGSCSWVSPPEQTAPGAELHLRAHNRLAHAPSIPVYLEEES